MLQKREDEDKKPKYEIDEKDGKFLMHTVFLFEDMERFLGEYMHSKYTDYSLLVDRIWQNLD